MCVNFLCGAPLRTYFYTSPVFLSWRLSIVALYQMPKCCWDLSGKATCQHCVTELQYRAPVRCDSKVAIATDENKRARNLFSCFRFCA